eukprot:Hpha_TRINITY_DN16746_c3_g7::TRINITY_DN16746_c3_g7_i1::g.76760::m.76760
MWRDPRACVAGGLLGGCHSPCHTMQRLERAYIRGPSHAHHWMAASAENDFADDVSVGASQSSATSPNSDDNSPANGKARGGRAAKARARAESQRWAPDQWVRMRKEVSAKGQKICSEGGYGQIVCVLEDKVRLAFSDESNNGERRELMLGKDRVELLRYNEHHRIAHRMKAHRAQLEREKRNKHLDTGDKHWYDWMDPIDEDDDDDEDYNARGSYTHPKSGRTINAPHALAAAKKAWKGDKRQQDVVVVDMHGTTHTFSALEFATAPKDGVRGGGPKFTAGKFNKQNRGQTSWGSFSPFEDD